MLMAQLQTLDHVCLEFQLWIVMVLLGPSADRPTAELMQNISSRHEASNDPMQDYPWPNNHLRLGSSCICLLLRPRRTVLSLAFRTGRHMSSSGPMQDYARPIVHFRPGIVLDGPQCFLA